MPTTIEGVLYLSTAEAARELNTTERTMLRRIKRLAAERDNRPEEIIILRNRVSGRYRIAKSSVDFLKRDLYEEV